MVESKAQQDFSAVYLDCTIGEVATDRIVIELFNDTPTTSQNFQNLCLGEGNANVSFIGTQFIEVYTGHFAQSQPIQRTAENMYGLSSWVFPFLDEKPNNSAQIKRNDVVMTNLESNKNTSQFYISFGQQKDKAHDRFTIFGRVIDGFATINRMEEVSVQGWTPQGEGRPVKAIEIVACGSMKEQEEPQDYQEGSDKEGSDKEDSDKEDDGDTGYRKSEPQKYKPLGKRKCRANKNI